MKNLLMIIIVSFVISGCGEYERNGYTHSGEKEFSIICIDGVQYIMKHSGYSGYMSPRFKQDGSLHNCSK